MSAATIIITATTPVAFRAGRNVDAAGTLDYVPGSPLRGALAAAHLLLRPGLTDEFTSWFAGEAIRFGNGYPSGNSSGGTINAQPIPRTALCCKRFRGFFSDGKAGTTETHGVRDSLIPSALFALSGNESLQPLASLQKCRQGATPAEACLAPLDRFEGFYAESQDGKYRRAKTTHEFRTRNGISRQRGTANEAILYSREMLAAGTQFQARIDGPSDLVGTMLQFAREAADAGLLRAGNNRSRGLGCIHIADAASKEAKRDIRASVAKFDSELRRRGGAQSSGAAMFLPVTLESDVILRKDFSYCGRLDPNWLAEAAGVRGAALVYHAAAIRRC